MIVFRGARIPMGRDRRLKVTDWTLRSGECWVITGRGGTGKTSLARVVAGVPDASGRLRTVPGLERRLAQEGPGAWISFDREKEIREELRRNDDSEWSGRPDDGTVLEDFIGGENGRSLLDGAMAAKLSGRGIRHLSTGEFRQVLIAREAGRNPALAVLDEPWEGLDVEARPRLTDTIRQWRESGVLIVITVNRTDDIPPFATGVVHLENDEARVVRTGGEQAASAADPGTGGRTDDTGKASPTFSANRPARGGDADGRTAVGAASDGDADAASDCRIPPPGRVPPETGDVLVELRDVSLAYHGRPVLKDVNWTIKAGESWLLTGPNGSGKTTLMNLICGDEPRGYGQDIRIFGRAKGSGESTAWIQSRMGRVSAMLQESVSRHATAAEVVGSGLRDAMVLTDELDGFERALAAEWLDVLGTADRADVPFFRLPYGERRLALIARAMINHPPLLLLDEPMHGLDNESRDRVIRLVDALIRDTGTTVLFVSHRPEDAPASIGKHLRLIPDGPGGCSRAAAGLR